MTAIDLAASLGAAMLAHARAAIADELGVPAPDAQHHAGLEAQGATFVTLTLDGSLRGCIGTLQAHRTLLRDVRANALAAAFRDPRFAALTAGEFMRVRVEVSLLEAPVPMLFASEQDALAQLHPGTDGVVLDWNGHRSTFLPQVWEALPERGEFLRQLRRKAGLPADFWAPDLRLSRYAVRKWVEVPPGAARGAA